LGSVLVVLALLAEAQSFHRLAFGLEEGVALVSLIEPLQPRPVERSLRAPLVGERAGVDPL
jgi:hypothetical protein